MVDITDADVTELIARMDDAADAYIRGDHRHYFSLFDHPDDYTLMAPDGGETPGLRAHRRTDRGGQTVLRVRARPGSTSSAGMRRGDLVVLCAVERQHAVVGGRPDQDWSLRVTIVFRARRPMADRAPACQPLVREIPFDHCAELAGGLDG